MYICLITAIILKIGKTEKEKKEIKKEEGNDKVTAKRGRSECWKGREKERTMR